MLKNYLKKDSKKLFFLFLLGIPFYIWLYAIGIELNKKINSRTRIHPILFHITIGFPLVYLPIAIFGFFSQEIPFNTIQTLHFTAMGTSFIALILVSMTIIRFEKSNNLKVSNEFELFFGIWFYVFGIWFIQAKLNKYAKLLAKD